MNIGLDASNLRAGGGETHLRGLLGAAHPAKHGIARITVWGGRHILDQLPDAPWLVRAHERDLDGTLPARLWWQRTVLQRRAREACDVLVCPGGSYAGTFHPFVTMSRSLLPFEAGERQRFGLSWMRVKLALLRRAQVSTLRRAAGVIFLNEYARECVTRVTGPLRGQTCLIPHGVDRAFHGAARVPRHFGACSAEDPLRLLYVSTVDMYKHQWHVVDAVGLLRARGLPVSLELVGGAYPPALRRLRAAMARVDPQGRFVSYTGALPHAELPARYHAADAFVFASSCENMPHILLEAMASGLPIACARRGPMPGMLADGGTYFEPERPETIADALVSLLTDPVVAAAAADVARTRSLPYTWSRCADDTLRFVAEVGRRPC